MARRARTATMVSMNPLVVVVAPLVLAAVALVAFQRGYLAARRDDDARVRLLVEIVADAMAVAGDRPASDAVVRRLAQVLDADATAIGYVDAGRLHLFGMYGYTGGVRNHSLGKGEGLSGQAWARGEPIVVADVRTEPGYVSANSAIRSGVYVPGKARGRVALVVAAESTRVGAYGTKDVLLLAPVADLLASMLESRRMLREAEQLEERLLTLVGHEMRTPLTTIFGTLTTLRTHLDRVDEGSRDELLDAGLRASRRLERLVEALLMAARLDADDVTFRRSPVPVRSLVADAIEAAGATDRVAVDVPDDVAVTADPVHLGSVVQQLVENAITYGGDAPIEVVATARDTYVSIEVRDWGPGIAVEEQEAALSRFRRVGERSVPGSGLGLYLARRLTEGMNGSLALRSVPGQGTTVEVRLPPADVPPPLPSPVVEPAVVVPASELAVPLPRPAFHREQQVAEGADPRP
jgi:signal transduction histidine kinase